MKNATTGGITFRWTGEQLLVTTPQAQHGLSAEQTMELLVHLYEHHASIFETLQRLPGWARPEPATTTVAEERPKRLSPPNSVPLVIPLDEKQPEQ